MPMKRKSVHRAGQGEADAGIEPTVEDLENEARATSKTAAEKVAFDAAGLAAAKAGIGNDTDIYKATIEIQPPGLLHNSNAHLGDELEPEGGKKKKSGEDFDWTKASYVRDGRITHPAWHIRSAIAKGAKEFQIPGRGKKTYHDKARAVLYVEPEFIPIRVNGTPLTEPHEIHFCIAPTSTGSPKPTRRPLFHAGSRMTFIIYVYWGAVPGGVVRDVLIGAGRFLGIGDYRPEYGRFEVVEFVKVAPGDVEREIASILR